MIFVWGIAMLTPIREKRYLSQYSYGNEYFDIDRSCGLYFNLSVCQTKF